MKRRDDTKHKDTVQKALHYNLPLPIDGNYIEVNYPIVRKFLAADIVLLAEHIQNNPCKTVLDMVRLLHNEIYVSMPDAEPEDLKIQDLI